MKKALAVVFLMVLFSLPAYAALTYVNVDMSTGTNALDTKSAQVDARVLTANAAEVHTVPTWDDGGVTRKAGRVLFSSTKPFYIKLDGAAAIPAADITNGTSSELNPAWRWLAGNVTTIGLISPEDAIVTMTFFK